MNVRQLMEALGWDRVTDGDLFKRQVLTELLERRAKDAAKPKEPEPAVKS